MINKEKKMKNKNTIFVSETKCDVCNKWLNDYAYQITKKQQPNIESNYCGGHTEQQVQLSKKLKRGEEFLNNAKIYCSWTFSKGSF